jgi:hypothetical protein
MATLAQIYDWFMTGKKPTQAQFWASWGSFWNKGETIPQSAVSNLVSNLNAKAEKSQFDGHLTDTGAHAAVFATKEDKNQKGQVNGYAPLNEFIKIASEYLAIVDNLVTGGSDAILSAEQGKLLQNQVDAINTSLSTLLVNDLTTGGTTKALTAEQGKQLKIQINAINTLLSSNDINLDTVQELVDAIKTVQTSLSTILVNDLTTGGTTKALTAEMGKSLKALYDSLSTNKVDKVAGERLINAAEITKLSGLTNVITTIKPILSTVLATQNVAGFVTYINALTPVLVVGANEIVKYNTTDTGRVFQLNLRGRSFGVGQAAIVAADVLEVTEFLNKDIKLSNYPSTRNDGQLPTNKVLAPDVNGNLKLYTIATAPAPYLDVLIPDSYLPNNTGNFILKGSFFTPTMTVAIVGQTVNYVTFISDNEVRANVTTGAAEGSFSITLDNGISRNFPNALLIVLGTVYQPITSEWTNLVLAPNVSEIGTIKTTGAGIRQSGKWRIIPANINIRIQALADNSPFFNGAWDDFVAGAEIELRKTSDDTLMWKIYFRKYNESAGEVRLVNTLGGDSGSSGIVNGNPVGKLMTLERRASIWKLYINGTLAYTFGQTINEEMYFKAKVLNNEIHNIKYIELAS